MNQYDFAMGSGIAPPEYGKCERCRRRTEVDPVILGSWIKYLCKECQERIGKKKPDDGQIPDPNWPW